METLQFDRDSPWHEGEQEMHRLMRLPAKNTNPTSRGLPARFGHRVAASPLVALGTLDGQGGTGRPWVTVVGGEAGFARPVAEDVLALKATVDVSGLDPVVYELMTADWTGGDDGDGDSQEGVDRKEAKKREVTLDRIVRPEGGKMMAGLSIDLETRDRVKIAGRMIAGSMTGYQYDESLRDGQGQSLSPAAAGEIQVAFHIAEALGNCPKYLNKKHITPHVPSPRLAYQAKRSEEDGGAVVLPAAVLEVIDNADMFFIASKHGSESMDVNHRGGAPGFLRVAGRSQDSGGGGTLVYPEFSGNNLYQTLGNLRRDPQVGICVPDYDTGDVLYVTGTAEILIGDRAAAYLPRTKLAVKVEIGEARFIRDGLGFRGAPIDHSPYNPPVRYLATEKHDVAAAAASSDALAGGGVAVATLKTRDKITDTVTRYMFALSRTGDQRKKLARLEPWQPGQYVTLDFSEELDNGWRHMADDDPQSLNDDYVRSFTISAPLEVPYVREEAEGPAAAEPDRFEITVRRHGPVTALLSRWNLKVPLQVPVLGFGGADEFRMPGAAVAGDGGVVTDKDCIFLAQGVGITPLMAQAPGVLRAAARAASDDMAGRLQLLWGLRAEDSLLAEEVLGRIPGLAQVTTLFVTGKLGSKGGGGMSGSGEDDDAENGALRKVEGMGARVVSRRMGRDDVLAAGEKGRRRYYGCMSGVMRKALMKWTAEEDLVVESFDY